MRVWLQGILGLNSIISSEYKQIAMRVYTPPRTKTRMRTIQLLYVIKDEYDRNLRY